MLMSVITRASDYLEIHMFRSCQGMTSTSQRQAESESNFNPMIQLAVHPRSVLADMLLLLSQSHKKKKNYFKLAGLSLMLAICC